MIAALPPHDLWLYVAIGSAVGFVLLIGWARHMERAKRRKRGGRRR